MPNEITDISYKILENENGQETPALFISCNINNKAEAEAFVAEVQQAVFSQLLMPCQEAKLLMITIIGGIKAEAFRRLWLPRVEADELFAALIARLETAVVVHGTPAGEIVGQASLLA